MQLLIKHSLLQQFDKEIIPEPHAFRTMPFQLPHCHIDDFEQKISPFPLGTTIKKDIVNNTTAFAWFNTKTNFIKADISFKAMLEEFDPLNIHVYPPEFLTLRFHYSRQRWSMLIPYLETSNICNELKKMGKQIAEKTHSETFPFMHELAHTLSKTITIEGSNTRPISSPTETYNLKSGSAADVAWLMIQLLRIQGIATRFVRGYHYDETTSTTGMHCWLEVYVPGPGWFGIDPSKGKPADYTYIPVSTSSTPDGTLPLKSSHSENDRLLKSIVEIEKI